MYIFPNQNVYNDKISDHADKTWRPLAIRRAIVARPPYMRKHMINEALPLWTFDDEIHDDVYEQSRSALL
jgi:hypothetical protein